MAKRPIRASEPLSEEPFLQLRLPFTDEVQTRYEVARPLILKQSALASRRAQETGSHPQTVRRYVRRFERDGEGGFNRRLQEWENFYNYDRPHGALAGQRPCERLRHKALISD